MPRSKDDSFTKNFVGTIDNNSFCLTVLYDEIRHFVAKQYLTTACYNFFSHSSDNVR